MGLLVCPKCPISAHACSQRGYSLVGHEFGPSRRRLRHQRDDMRIDAQRDRRGGVAEALRDLLHRHSGSQQQRRVCVESSKPGAPSAALGGRRSSGEQRRDQTGRGRRGTV
jgi:hypothetical protein